MNSVPLPRAAFACRMARTARLLVDGAASAHIARCAACQAYYRATASIEGALRRQAHASRPAISAAPDALERRILRTVRESALAPTRRRPLRSAWVLATGAAAAIAVVSAVWMQRAAPAGPALVEASPPPTAEAAALVAAVETFSARFTQQVLPSAGALVANNPLHQEFGSMASDARSALDFLALNFLPTAPRSAATPPADRG